MPSVESRCCASSASTRPSSTPTATGSPCTKLGALLEQPDDVIGGGHRALVFSQFTGFLATVRHRLERETIGYCYLDGRTRQRERVLDASVAATTRCF